MNEILTDIIGTLGLLTGVLVLTGIIAMIVIMFSAGMLDLITYLRRGSSK